MMKFIYIAFLSYAGDVAGSVESISAMVKNAEASLGPVYMLVNCAGFARAQKFEDLSADLIKVCPVHLTLFISQSLLVFL